MNVSSKWAQCVALVLITSLTSLSSAQEATTQELVENQQYQSWAKHKPGTQVNASMTMNVQGQQIKSEITQKLVEVTPEKAVIEVSTKMNVPGVNVPPQTQKQEVPAKVAASKADISALPEGVTGEVKEVGNEKVTIDGTEYDCKVSEFTGEQNGVKMTGKVWSSMELPGGTAKVETKATGAQAFDMALTIDKVESK